MREKSKLKHILSGLAADNSCKLTWPHFDLMQFLDASQPTGTYGNTPSDTFTDSSALDKPVDQIVDETLTQTSNEMATGIASHVFCENTSADSMPCKKPFKQRIYRGYEID